MRRVGLWERQTRRLMGVSAGSSAAWAPSLLSLSGWWRGSYAGAPWAGVASAGTSSAENLEDGLGGSPTAGAAVNGLAPAQFDGVNDTLLSESGSGLGAFISAATWSGWSLVYIDTAVADPGAGSRRSAPAAWEDNGGTVLGLHIHAGGITLAQVDSGGLKEVNVAAASGVWHLAVYGFDGTNLWLSVDGAAASTVAAGEPTSLSTYLRLGASYIPDYFHGRLLDQAFAKVDLSGQIANLVGYVNGRYALSL